MGGLTDILFAICAEYFRGLFSSLQGFLVLHKIDNPPITSIRTEQNRQHQRSTNSYQTVLEFRRQQELEKRSKPPPAVQLNKISTPKRIFRCVGTNIASVFLVQSITYLVTFAGQDTLLSSFFSYLSSCILFPVLIIVRLISTLWFADVAGAALRFRGQTNQKIPDFARAISDFVHAIIVELVFLLQALLFFNLNLPILSTSLGFIYMALLNSLYSFDYIWMSNGVTLMKWLILFGRKCLCDMPTSSSSRLFCTTNLIKITTRRFSTKIPSLTFSSLSQRKETGKLIKTFLSPKKTNLILNSSLRRYYSSGGDKRAPKLIKDLKISDLKGIAILALPYKWRILGQLIVNDLRTNVFRNILQQDMAFFDKNKVGEIVSRLSSDAYIVGSALSTNLGDGIRSLFTSIGTAGMMVYTSPELSLLGAVVIPFIAGTFFLYGKWLGYYAIQMQEAIAGTNQLATERLSNVKTVRVFVAENKELNSYKDKIVEIWEISRKEGRATAFVVGGFYIFGYGFLSSLLYYGSHLIECGLLTYGDLSSFVLYAILCSTSISNIRTFYSELMRGLGASSRLFELRDTKPRIPLSGGICLTDLKEGIKFESVAFSYPDRDPIFNDVTFKIPLSSTTAIVGPSGCGKSTIAHLLLRLYNPTQGRILIDGQDMRHIDPSEWRKICGVVSQEPVLFSATIKENILYGVPEDRKVSDEELYEVAQLSNSLDFIRSFPQGFNTMVGEHGSSMLSGGQRQRIAIARALIKRPRFIILDEATSALDATSEYLVRKALEALLAQSGQTVLIIAHRLSTIKHAEQIVVLDKGSVAEIGRFDDLMAINDGIFQRLVEKQSLDWRFDKF
ncbi:hypothetical protein Mgra_00007358 [Meloidogyne graminicola]|uniref:Uncharacterized protein n=1 Tax=Meloidogyne graminicola TaxID=189291 RepID=A0A8S9ZJ06_9BILA|nr:hypothetical protein Mgra_00007358 [Meloidogyne graminicola]